MFKNRKKQAERGMDRLAAVARRDDVRKDAKKGTPLSWDLL